MWKSFVAIGDSVTEGVGDRVDGMECKSWADHLYNHLKNLNPNISYKNLAIRGQTSQEIRMSQFEEAVSLEPDIVAVLVGGNDVLKGVWDADIFEQEFQHMLHAFSKMGATIISTTVPDFPMLHKLPFEKATFIRNQLQELNHLIRKNSKEFNVRFSELWHAPFTLNENTWSKDGIHPNSLGYMFLAEGIKKTLAI
jgi:lysophospholipase L1-like esterase